MYTEKAYAKINLILNILYKRADGYHEIFTIMQTLKLHDKLDFEVNSDRVVRLSHNIDGLPLGENNLICRAAELMRKLFNINEGLDIRLEKNIPISAGLGGGSSDAAATIRACNNIFKLELSDSEMENLAKELGADIPFLIKGGTAIAEGIGEKLTFLRTIKDLSIILIKPNISVSTAWAYKNFENNKLKKSSNEEIINAIEKNDRKTISKRLQNDLENVTINKYPIINDLKIKMFENGAQGVLMSGSGPTVFGIYSDNSIAKKAEENLLEIYKNKKMKIILTNTI
jgi:4-diphosphocytidyl-2-C-methyl-D-erythritol kinase